LPKRAPKVAERPKLSPAVDHAPGARHRVRLLSWLLPVLVGCTLYVAMALHGVAHKSGTYDEFVHVTAGYSYWTLDDYRLNPENGNWSQRLVALPLVAEGAGRAAFPSLDQQAWTAGDMWALSDQFFFAPGRDADALLFAARAMVAIVGALLGALVFFWARSLFGDPGACVALAVYVFSPTMLAHGALATSDVVGAAFFTASLWTVWTVMQRVTPFTLGVSVLTVSGLFLAKPSGPILVPIAVAMMLVQLASGRVIEVRLGRRADVRARGARAGVHLAVFAAHALVVFALIWASYGFRYSAFGTATAANDSFLEPWSSILDTPSWSTSLVTWSRDHHVLPEAYLYGFATVTAYARERISFLDGSIKFGGSLAFFPYAVLVKTTIPALLLVAAVPVVAVGRARGGRRIESTAPAAGVSLYDLTPLIAGIVVYGAFAISSSLNIGHRHLLPLIPAAIVLTGLVGQMAFGSSFDAKRLRAAGRQRAAALAVLVLLLWHAGESVWISPNYLAYFNEIVGGPSHGYRHLVDSSLDWGQDLPGLKAWLDEQGLQGPNHPPVYLSYFGTAFPSAYGIDARVLANFPDREPAHVPGPLAAGTYCFSATMLQGLYFMTPGKWSRQYETDYQSMRYNMTLWDSTSTNPAARQALLRQTGEDFWVKNFRAFEHLRAARIAAFLRQREPDAEIGYSILVYRVSDDELTRALVGPAPID
jgi:hypothetical protein